MPLENVNLQNRGSRSPESTIRGSQYKSCLGIRFKIGPGRMQNQSQNQKDSEIVLKPKLTSGPVQYRRAHPFNLPAQPFNLSISDKLWTLEKNKGHFIILELNSEIIKWPYFLPKVFSL